MIALLLEGIKEGRDELMRQRSLTYRKKTKNKISKEMS